MIVFLTLLAIAIFLFLPPIILFLVKQDKLYREYEKGIKELERKQ